MPRLMNSVYTRCSSSQHQRLLPWLLGLCLLLSACASHAAERPAFRSFSHERLERNVVSLNGTWALYWQALLDPELLAAALLSQDDAALPLEPWASGLPEPLRIQVPDFWSRYRQHSRFLTDQGQATYALRLRLPDNYDAYTQRTYGLALGIVDGAYRVWLHDGDSAQLLAARGFLDGHEAPEGIPRLEPFVSFRAANPDVLLVVHLRNDSAAPSGIVRSVTLGYEEQMKRWHSRSLISNSISLGSLLIIGIFFCAFFLLRPQDRATLLFALMCLGLAALQGLEFFRIGLSSPWTLALTVTLAWSVGLCFSGFLQTLFAPVVHVPRWLYGLAFTLFAATLLALLLPLVWYGVAQGLLNISIGLFAVYNSLGLAKALWYRQPYALLISISAFLFLLVIVTPLFTQNSLLLSALPLVTVVFAFDQSLIFIVRSAKAMNRVERVSLDLERSNATLEARVLERTARLSTLHRISQQLNRAKGDKEILQSVLSAFDDPDLGALLQYIDLDSHGQPEWLEVVALQIPQAPNNGRYHALGERYYIPDFASTRSWFDAPHHHQPILLHNIRNDLPADDPLREVLLAFEVEAAVIVPLSHAGRWVGLLYFIWSQPHSFDSYALQLYEALPSLIAPVVENQRLIARLEQKVAERTAELREKLRLVARFRALANATSDFIAYTDLEGKVLEINRAGLALLGYQDPDKRPQTLAAYTMFADSSPSPEQASKQNSEQDAAISESSEARSLAAQQKVLAIVFEQGIFTSEGLLRHRQGHNIPVSQVISRLDDDKGQAMGFGVIARDISSRKRDEALLQQAKDEAEAANRAKSLFLANMSHELRTPLNAILGFSQLLQRDSDLSDGQHEHLRIIMQSGEHLLDLINDVLEMSKIEVGRSEYHPTSFDLLHSLQDIEAMMHLRAERKGLYMQLFIDDDLPRYIESDARKLRQVLLNLLSNAIKFSDQGTISLHVSAQLLSADALEHLIQDGQHSRKAFKKLSGQHDSHALAHIFFSVQDQGRGIANDELPQLFQAFSQTSSGQQAQEGTGLGLSISRQFVQLMGGDIQVTSQLGQGSTFRFDILARVLPEAPQSPEISRRRVLGLRNTTEAPRILIVEDQAKSRLLLRRLLEAVGFSVREASNGQEGINAWQQWQPALIWMDMRMPVMDGYEATRYIKARDPQTCIIALTASAFESERQAILAVGCDDLLHKPFREEEIFACMAKHLGLQYCYQEDENSSSPASSQSPQLASAELLRSLPTPWQQALHQAATQADAEEIASLLGEIRHNYPQLAQALHELADDFRFDTIIAWTA